MKIYFAGSIRGGRDDKQIYAQIIEILKSYGEVLTEHIGDMSLSEKGEGGDAEFIHRRDMEWLKESDVVVAEVTTPSLGVGYELGIAEGLGKKVLCIFRENAGRSLSAMISGNGAFDTKYYKSVEDLPEIFDNYLK